MDFSISTRQRELLDKLDAFLNGCGFDRDYFLACETEKQPPRAFEQALARELGPCFLPQAAGGEEADLLTLALLTERLGQRGFPCGMLLNLLQARDMLALGTPEQQARVFAYLREQGGQCFSFGITDGPEKTMLSAGADGLVLNGHKAYVSNGLTAPFVMVLAREEEAEGASLVLLPRDCPGMAWKPLGRSGLDGELVLKDVRVASDARLGKPGEGMAQIAAHMELERFVLAAVCLGLARCATDEARAAVRAKAQKKPLGDGGLIQERLVEMELRLRTLALLVYETAWKLDNGTAQKEDIPLLKLYAAREGFAVADMAMQLLGGKGFADTSRVFACWKELRGYRIGGGADEVMIRLAGKRLLGE